jgi:HSP20 family protein
MASARTKADARQARSEQGRIGQHQAAAQREAADAQGGAAGVQGLDRGVVHGWILTQIKMPGMPAPSMKTPASDRKETAMANVTRYTPFDELFDDFTKGFWLKPVSMPGTPELKMKLDVKEDEKAYTVHADLPGVSKDDIHVDVHGDQVSIRAEVKKEKEDKQGEKTLHSERYYGAISRSFSLPSEVDESGVVAKYRDGVLDLTLPKKSGGPARRIAVQ